MLLQKRSRIADEVGRHLVGLGNVFDDVLDHVVAIYAKVRIPWH